MNKKRLIVALITGTILGLICILGAQVRSGFTQTPVYLFAFWFNRVLMGVVIGLITFQLPLKQTLLRGAIIGLLVSFAFYSATGFEDVIGFAAGIIYGVIIEYAAYKLNSKA
ncbi:MAG: hypothetical protein ACNA7K_04825 [Acholeplasmataceae bacterium]